MEFTIYIPKQDVRGFEISNFDEIFELPTHPKFYPRQVKDFENVRPGAVFNGEYINFEYDENNHSAPLSIGTYETTIFKIDEMDRYQDFRKEIKNLLNNEDFRKITNTKDMNFEDMYIYQRSPRSLPYRVRLLKRHGSKISLKLARFWRISIQEYFIGILRKVPKNEENRIFVGF